MKATPPPLTEQARHTLEVLLSDVLPSVPDKGFPCGEFDVLHRHVCAAPAGMATLHAMLEALQSSCAPQTYPSLTAEARLDVLTTMKRRHLRLFSDFFTLAIQAYCLDPRVSVALGEHLRPPFPEGYLIADASFDLLEPVYDRGPCYRPC